MYPGAAVPGGSGDPFGSLLGVVVAGGLIYILVVLAVAFISYYIFYRVVRAAVRDGVVDAHRKTGGLGSSGSGTSLSGWPPDQSVAPAASGYRGPTG